MTLDDLVARARALADRGGRRLLGITGPPGAGKSTLAETIAKELSPRAVVVSLDGFHLANCELQRLGRRDRKGAVDTFDAAGYVSLLRRLAEPEDGVVYAPEFRRDLEEAVAGAVPVPPDVPLVVTEGNYLLVDQGPFREVRGLLDEVWYLDIDERVRLERLVSRHMAYGKDEAEARRWAFGSDQRNAELVRRTRHRADLVVPEV